MADKTPRKFKTGSENLLGKFFRALVKSSGQAVAPDGPRPDLPDVSGTGIDPATLANEFGTFGSRSNLYGSLNNQNPDLAKQYSDMFAKQRAFDAAQQAFDTTDAAQQALGSGEMTMGQMGTLLKDYWGQQPFLGKAAGAGLALGNLGGLVDNDKFGGQLGGLALGGLGSKLLGMQNPGAAALLTMGGGELGALFDKLRAKREGQVRQMAQQAPRR